MKPSARLRLEKMREVAMRPSFFLVCVIINVSLSLYAVLVWQVLWVCLPAGVLLWLDVKHLLKMRRARIDR